MAVVGTATQLREVFRLVRLFGAFRERRRFMPTPAFLSSADVAQRLRLGTGRMLGVSPLRG